MFKLGHVNELYLTEYRLKNSCFSGNVWSALNACHPMLTDCKDELKYLYSDIWTSVLFVEKSVILYMWRTFREIDVCQRHPCRITFKNWISTFFLTTKLNTVDDIWRFRLYLCLTQKFNFTEFIAHQSHRIPIQTCYFTIPLFQVQNGGFSREKVFIPSTHEKDWRETIDGFQRHSKRLQRNVSWSPLIWIDDWLKSTLI